MKKINSVIYLIVAVVIIAISIAGVFVYFYKPKVLETNKTAVNNNTNVNDLNSVPAPAVSSEIPQHVQDYLKDRYGENTKLEPATGKIIDNNQLWAINIPLKSIGQEIVITKEPWMLSGDIYDKQLTELENKQKEDFKNSGEARYKIIFERQDLTDQLISKMRDSINSLEQGKLYFDNQKKNTQSMLDTLSISPYNKKFPEKALADMLNNCSTRISIIEDIERMADALINIKKGTIKHIQEKNSLLTFYSADDEDTITLVISWHTEGYQRTAEEGSKIFEQIKPYLQP